jgi:hypothetical protein
MSYEKVDRPAHYNGKNGVITVIDIIEDYDLGFSLGNVIKYGLRAGRKPGEDGLDDLKKARWYLDREIQRIQQEKVVDANLDASKSDLKGLAAYLAAAAGSVGAVRVPPMVEVEDDHEEDHRLFDEGADMLRQGIGDWSETYSMMEALLRAIIMLYSTADLESAASDGSLMDTLREVVRLLEAHDASEPDAEA